MKPAGERQNVIHRHSGWSVPAGFAVAILALCGLFLAWYLRPGPPEGAPTGDATPVALSVRGLPLSVPGNYIVTAAARAGGAQEALTLAALFPDMRGYSEDDARLFAGDAPDSPAIRLLLKGDPNGMDADARLARIYMPGVANPAGDPESFGLTRYAFKSGSAYNSDDLFAGRSETGLVLFLCERAQPDLPAPNCLGSGRPPAKGLNLSFRFKRSHLSRWREIVSGVQSLMLRFEKAN